MKQIKRDSEDNREKMEQNKYRKIWCPLSHFRNVRLFVTLWTIAYQAPPSMGFSRQEYWSRQLCLSLDFPGPGIEPSSLASPALADKFFTTSATWEAHIEKIITKNFVITKKDIKQRLKKHFGTQTEYIQRKTSPRHTIIMLQKNKNKGKNKSEKNVKALLKKK